MKPEPPTGSVSPHLLAIKHMISTFNNLTFLLNFFFFKQKTLPVIKKKGDVLKSQFCNDIWRLYTSSVG